MSGNSSDRRLKNNLKIVLGFFALILIIIIVSFVIKFISLVANSSFNHSKTFSLLIASKNPSKSSVLLLNPTSNEVSILTISDVKAPNVEKYLGYYLDGEVIYENKEEIEIENTELASEIQNLFFNYVKIKTNLNPIDIFRIWWFARSVPTRNIHYEVLSAKTSTVEIDREVVRLLVDPMLLSEKVSIEVVNATGVSGLGGRVARALVNMGANVVSVSTADSVSKKSSIEYLDLGDGKGATVERLEEIFDITSEGIRKKGVSDIIITVGEDRMNSLPF